MSELISLYTLVFTNFKQFDRIIVSLPLSTKSFNDLNKWSFGVSEILVSVLISDMNRLKSDPMLYLVIIVKKNFFAVFT